MNCPGGMLVYKSQPHSYRDLPLRVGELGIVHRHELSGALHGLFRVRCFTQDDAHIFMTPGSDQGRDQGRVPSSLTRCTRVFGFKYHMELSTHAGGLTSARTSSGRSRPTACRPRSTSWAKPYVINEGDGAFYGPKIDFHLDDSLGRTWQCGTIQLDMQMPERFDLEYVGADGEKHRPVMIHRVVLRLHRALHRHPHRALCRRVPAVARARAGQGHAHHRPHEQTTPSTLPTDLEKAGMRTEIDLRNEKIGYKIREAQSAEDPVYACPRRQGSGKRHHLRAHPLR